MNTKGQIPVLGVLFSLLVFLVLWAMFFAEWISFWATKGIVDNNLTGLEAFFLAYINVWILCGVIIGALATLYFGGNQ